MFFRAIGYANWLMSMAVVRERLEKAMPFARISKERTSTGYRACSGVMPKAKTALKRKMKAMKALLADGAPVFCCIATDTMAAIQMKLTLEKVPISMGRRPSLSTKKAPKTACKPH
jgi:hypothetical protein